MTIVCSLLPHSLHLGRAWLEVAKVLLPKPRLFVYFDVIALEWRGLGIVRSQGSENALGSLASATIRAGEEVKRVVGAKHIAQAMACVVCLLPAILGELDAVVRNGLVDFTVLCKGLRLAVGLNPSRMLH